MHKKIFGVIFGFALLLFLAATADAATSIRLEQPKSPTNQGAFNINFVTLDTEGNTITVKCFKKGPSDGGFVQFGSDITISPVGGNSGDCSVNSSILNANGSYQFQATTNNGSSTVFSNTVTVNYNTSGPGTPTNYGKEKPSSCVYRIKFKSADDAGKTVKVEVYRSDQTSFNADSGTRVATVSISSNTDGQADVTSPDCSKEYFFAVRSFDSAGNGSGVVGDSVTIVTTTTISASPSPATGAIAVSGGLVLGKKTGTSEEELGGEVQGEATEESQPQASTPQAETQQGKEESPLFSARNILIAFAIILAILVIWYLLFRPKKEQV